METKVVEYAHLIIKLLQDVVYDDDKVTWNDLLTYQVAVREYFARVKAFFDLLIGRTTAVTFL